MHAAAPPRHSIAALAPANHLFVFSRHDFPAGNTAAALLCSAFLRARLSESTGYLNLELGLLFVSVRYASPSLLRRSMVYTIKNIFLCTMITIGAAGLFAIGRTLQQAGEKQQPATDPPANGGCRSMVFRVRQTLRRRLTGDICRLRRRNSVVKSTSTQPPQNPIGRRVLPRPKTRRTSCSS